MKKIKLITAIILAAILAIAMYIMVTRVFSFVQNADLNASETDPMFAEEMVIPTPPESFFAVETQRPHKSLNDYSYEDAAPVDRTVDSLIKEAERYSVKF